MLTVLQSFGKSCQCSFRMNAFGNFYKVLIPCWAQAVNWRCSRQRMKVKRQLQYSLKCWRTFNMGVCHIPKCRGHKLQVPEKKSEDRNIGIVFKNLYFVSICVLYLLCGLSHSLHRDQTLINVAQTKNVCQLWLVQWPCMVITITGYWVCLRLHTIYKQFLCGWPMNHMVICVRMLY